MLDQNTDRMWFVIGAVIVGAAIIFIANGTMPDIFASVTDSFNTATDNAIVEIGALTHGENLLDSLDFEEEVWITFGGDRYDFKGGITYDRLPVTPGERYRMDATVPLENYSSNEKTERYPFVVIGAYRADGSPIERIVEARERGGVEFTIPEETAYIRYAGKTTNVEAPYRRYFKLYRLDEE